MSASTAGFGYISEDGRDGMQVEYGETKGLPTTNTDINRDTRNEGDKLSSLGDSHTNVPIGYITRSSQCPAGQLKCPEQLPSRLTTVRTLSST